MYTIKLKSKESIQPSYCNEHIILPVKEVEEKDDMFFFLMSESEATKLTHKLIVNRKEEFDYISIVQMTKHKPHRPYQVIFYKEFK